MPMIVISGLPASGKTTRAKALLKYFTGRGKKVHLISENVSIANAGFPKNEYFADSQKEKQVRSDIKSEALRLLNKEDVVIVDGGNYIKGYRYELFCATKAARSTQCTLFCGIQEARAWQLNQERSDADVVLTGSEEQVGTSNVPYTREIFDALCMRYEEPHGNCRWDSPLFVVFPDDSLDFEAIYGALYESKPLPPNQSTQNPPLSATNYLFELDKLTQQIVGDVLAARKIGNTGPVPVKDSQVKVEVPAAINAIQLNRLRRQFLNYSKLHHATTSTLDKVPQLFVQFLNSNCNE
ncbi:protein KTI12 homolog [Anastrepha ludens]|uniref:protein KTI12 homolog n=1 Tax=Anastrepha ludens TaxID=28586 RepID=UPI0023B1666C|nr:protein KTI12 homolog [Anastrepha ludens]